MRSWQKELPRELAPVRHVHGRLRHEDEQTPWLLVKDVGVVAGDYKPVGLEDLRRYMTPREKAFAEHRAAVIAHDESGDRSFLVRGSLAWRHKPSSSLTTAEAFQRRLRELEEA